MKKYYKVLHLLLMIILGLGVQAGCTPYVVLPTLEMPTRIPVIPSITPSKSPSPTPTSTAMPTSTTISSPTSMPIELTTKVYRPLPTVASTLDAQQRSVYIQNLLTTNGGCTLPCLLGIIPGKSSWEEVQRFFATLGEPAPHQNFHSKYGIISYYYRFDPPKENPKSLGWAIEFYISENEINLLSFNIASPARNPVFTSQYSVKAITEAMGEPTAIGVYIYVYSFPGTASYYTFDVTYHVADMWLVFKYRGFVERPDDETLIFCPTHPYLDHTGSGLDDTVSFFIQPGKDLYTDLELLNLGLPPSEGFPFKMVTGEDVHYFYEKMMAAKPGEKVCFTSKVSVFGIHGGAK